MSHRWSEKSPFRDLWLSVVTCLSGHGSWARRTAGHTRGEGSGDARSELGPLALACGDGGARRDADADGPTVPFVMGRTVQMRSPPPPDPWAGHCMLDPGSYPNHGAAARLQDKSS